LIVRLRFLCASARAIRQGQPRCRNLYGSKPGFLTRCYTRGLRDPRKIIPSPSRPSLLWRRSMIRCKVLSGRLALGARWLSARADTKPAPFDVKDVAVRISGPYAHENLAVFLLHGKDQDDRDYLTLDQGLAKKLVAISEKASASVGELQIE